MTRDESADAISGDPHIVPPDRIDADEIEGRCDVLARYSVLFHTYLGGPLKKAWLFKFKWHH